MNLPYASLTSRFIALILDSLILALPLWISNRIAPMLGGWVVWFFYAPVLESSAVQATLGKHILGIQVTNLEGQRISFRVATIRNLIKFFSGAILFAGFFLALFTRRKQALHDILADTVVISAENDQPLVDAWCSSIKDLTRSRSSRCNSDTLSQLERLQALRDRGVLTEEEFQARKRKILSEEIE